MSDELKRCPYCGEKFIIFHRGEGEWLRYFVEHNRSCLMYYHFENVVGYTDVDLLTKELNTRPLEDALLAECNKWQHAYGVESKLRRENFREYRTLQSERDALLSKLEEAKQIMRVVNNWCGTDDGAYALPYEPPWYRDFFRVLKLLEAK